jgi:hypothetical protein
MAPAGAMAGTVQIVPVPDLGIQVLHFEGRIEAGDLKRIQDLVPKAKSLNPQNQVYVSWHSPGGDLGEGMEIGRYLREQGIGTIVPPSGTCASACVMAFWGGFDSEKRKVRRIAMPGARLAVHRAVLRDPSFARKVKADPNAVVEALQRHLAVTMDYLQAMEVSLEVQKRQFGTSNQEAYILKEPELEGSGVLLPRRSSSGWALRSPQAASVSLPPALQPKPEPQTTASVPQPKPPVPQTTGSVPQTAAPSPQTTASLPQAPRGPEDLRVMPFVVKNFGQDADVVLPNGQSARGHWTYGTRNGVECLDVDVNASRTENQGLSVSLCFAKLVVAGSLAYSPDIFQGPLAPQRASLITRTQQTVVLPVVASRFVHQPLRLEWERLPQQAHFYLMKPSDLQGSAENFSAIRLVLGSAKDIIITINLPESMRGSRQREASAPHNAAVPASQAAASSASTPTKPPPVSSPSRIYTLPPSVAGTRPRQP